MKIVSYNISSCTQEKVDFLLSLNADVYVVPEIACQDKISIPNEYDMKWKFDCPTKGLGVIWKKDRGDFATFYKPDFNYAIPIIYEGIFILGFWPTILKGEKKNYTQIAKEIIEYYTPYFKNYSQCIITGDFNLYHKENNSNKAADILTVDSILKENGFHSIYHERANEEPGCETRNTFFMHFKKDNPFFLDYTYSKLPIKNYYFIENPEEKFSDHIGQVIHI